MSTPQPPAFAPDPKRRSLRSRHSPDEAPVPGNPPAPSLAVPPSYAPQQAAPAAPVRRSVRDAYDSPEERMTLPVTPSAEPPRRASRMTPGSAMPAAHPPGAPASGGQPRAYAPSSMRTPRSAPAGGPGQAPQAGQARYASHAPAARLAAPGHHPQQGAGYLANARPHGAPPVESGTGGRRPRRRWGRRLGVVFMLLVVVLIAWPSYLYMDANRNFQRVDALSSAPDTPGTTFLLAGSDSRASGPIQDDTEGARADSVMLVHIAPNGQSVAISLPRDTWVDIPGYGENKLNAAYALEGSPLLVQTVEQLSGLTVDHYVEIGMGGVADIVDAVGGVELCLDYDVNDELSELVWTAGCHVADGRTALAFSRMRYADPLGDIGRAERQRQVVTKTLKTAMSPSTLLWPPSALALERAGAGALAVDRDASAWDVFTMVRAFRSAGAEGLTGTPPIVSLNYDTYSGSAVLLEDVTAPDFFAKLRNGELTPEDLKQVTP